MAGVAMPHSARSGMPRRYESELSARPNIRKPATPPVSPNIIAQRSPNAFTVAPTRPACTITEQMPTTASDSLTAFSSQP